MRGVPSFAEVSDAILAEVDVERAVIASEAAGLRETGTVDTIHGGARLIRAHRLLLFLGVPRSRPV